MDDLISRQAAIKDAESWVAVDEYEKHLQKKVVEWLKELPPAQSETAKRIIGKSKDGMTLWYQCDMCNEPVDAQDNFCRECGRRLIDE